MGANKLLISVVDDDAAIRKALLRLFSAHDLDAVAFDSGAAFLDSLANRCPDCLILDLHMPGISGLDVLRHLLRTGQSVPTIIITAYDEPEKQCFSAGAVAYLQKPIDEQVLLAAIASASRTNNQSGEARTVGYPAI